MNTETQCWLRPSRLASHPLLFSPRGAVDKAVSRPGQLYPFVRPLPFRVKTSLVAFVFLDQVGGGLLSQLRMAMRVNPQSSSVSSFPSVQAEPSGSKRHDPSQFTRFH